MTDPTLQSFFSSVSRFFIDATNSPVLLSSIFIGTCVYVFFNISTAIVVTLMWFSGYGLLDHLFRQSKSLLSERCKPIESRTILIDFGAGEYDAFTKVIDETKYAGLVVKLFGEEKHPPIGFSKPLCPSCYGNLLERARVVFPFFLRIRFFCPKCKKHYPSKYTRSEIITQLAQLYDVKL